MYTCVAYSCIYRCTGDCSMFLMQQLPVILRRQQYVVTERAVTSMCVNVRWLSISHKLEKNGRPKMPEIVLWYFLSWWRGTVVERRSLAGELSLSCA